MSVTLKKISEQTVFLQFILDPSHEGYGHFIKGVNEALKMEQVKYLILDFGNVRSANNDWLRELTLLARELKENRGGRIIAIRCHEKVKIAIKLRGLDTAIMLRAGLEDALRDTDPRAQKSNANQLHIDVGFINPFITAAVEALKIQAGMDSSPEKPPYLKTDTESHQWDLVGILGLSSKQFKGAIAICFTEKVYLAIMSAMLGEKVEVLTPEIADGAGELLNIIFGQAKTVLNEKDFGVDKAIPTVVTGADVKIKQLSDRPTIVLPFKTEHGVYHIEIAIDQSSKKAAVAA